MINPEKYFDQENFWLLETYVIERPDLNDRELGYFICDLIHKSVHWGGRNEQEFDAFCGRKWSFDQFLFALQAPIEQVPSDDKWLRSISYGDYDFSWFIPILEKLTKDIPVSYQEANAVYQATHGGKNLRLFPSPSSPRGYDEFYLSQIDYNY